MSYLVQNTYESLFITIYNQVAQVHFLKFPVRMYIISIISTRKPLINASLYQMIFN